MCACVWILEQMYIIFVHVYTKIYYVYIVLAGVESERATSWSTILQYYATCTILRGTKYIKN